MATVTCLDGCKLECVYMMLDLSLHAETSRILDAWRGSTEEHYSSRSAPEVTSSLLHRMENGQVRILIIINCGARAAYIGGNRWKHRTGCSRECLLYTLANTN